MLGTEEVGIILFTPPQAVSPLSERLLVFVVSAGLKEQRFRRF